MFKSFASHPARTTVADLPSVGYNLEGATTTFSFHDPNDRYVVTCRTPPAVSTEQTDPQKCQFIFAPKPHWHRNQEEEFHLVRGSANFWIDGKQIHVKEGGTLTIYPGQFHTFCNASTEEEMEIEFVLEPETRLRDENYFSTFSSIHLPLIWCSRLTIFSSFREFPDLPLRLCQSRHQTVHIPNPSLPAVRRGLSSTAPSSSRRSPAVEGDSFCGWVPHWALPVRISSVISRILAGLSIAVRKMISNISKKASATPRVNSCACKAGLEMISPLWTRT